MVEVFAFACRHKCHPEWRETIYNAETAGKAKAEYFADVSEPWPDVRWTDLRVRKVGAPQASSMFRHIAKLRGMPDIQPGERITSKHGDGVIVDAGSGANFEILFDSGEFSGRRLMLHPMEFQRQPLPASVTHD